MTGLDIAVAALFLAGMLGAGLWVGRRQEARSFFVGNRKMGSAHLGLSIAATDVGGGFSIGLAGLGFTMGLSASWLLFTGLVGAWLAAILVVPRVKRIAEGQDFQSYADFLRARCGEGPARIAAIVSTIGYTAFVGAQVLAGAKLASAGFDLPLNLTVAVLAVVVVVYTSAGGLEAVVYTDTIQWAVVVIGLLIALPLAVDHIGGMDALAASLPASHLSLTAVGVQDIVVWTVSIVPIWFVAMTLYQRIYAARDVSTAKRAFFIAGLFEYPVIAFLGAGLGLCGRALFPDLDPLRAEESVPLLLREVLPSGVAGLVLSAYFAAILSTADSCLLAASGHVTVDFFARARPNSSDASRLRVARIASVVLGTLSISVALALPSVLDAMLLAYGLMVSGLFAVSAAALRRKIPPRIAMTSMLTGGGTYGALSALPYLAPWREPILVALPASVAVLLAGLALRGRKS